MNSQSIRSIIRKNFIFYLTGFLILFGMKLFYSKANCEMLKWILAPTAGWVSILSRIPFSYEPGTGYINYSFRFLIAPSCSGVSFMIITAATLIFSFIHRMDTKKKGFLWMLGSLCFSYIFTILINGLRIIAAIYIPFYLTMLNIHILSPEELHTLIGTVVYFTSLLVIYSPAGSLSLKISGAASGKRTLSHNLKCISPLFWYFLIVLGIPFLNRAYAHNNRRFLNYAVLVGSVCLGIFLISIVFPALLIQLSAGLQSSFRKRFPQLFHNLPISESGRQKR